MFQVGVGGGGVARAACFTPGEAKDVERQQWRNVPHARSRLSDVFQCGLIYDTGEGCSSREGGLSAAGGPRYARSLRNVGKRSMLDGGTWLGGDTPPCSHARTLSLAPAIKCGEHKFRLLCTVQVAADLNPDLPVLGEREERHDQIERHPRPQTAQVSASLCVGHVRSDRYRFHFTPYSYRYIALQLAPVILNLRHWPLCEV